MIGGRILLLLDQRVMLDADLAELYGVQTKVLVHAVKRNLMRFPVDFMLQMTAEEFRALRSQSVTSNPSRGGRSYSTLRRYRARRSYVVLGSRQSPRHCGKHRNNAHIRVGARVSRRA